ncbi:MAG: ATP-dependent helicase C-terminal domain-containing protein, partial [Gemmatimonadaceae bacterium]
RAGRAGRTSPGVAYRVWAAEEDLHLLDRPRPEILETDLAPLALDLASAGIVDVTELRWLDTPPSASLDEARALLRQLGALDDANRITPHGREISALGVHPRIAHMLLAGRSSGRGATACAVAALLEERDVIRRSDVERDADIGLRVALVAEHGRGGADVDADALRRVRERSRVLREQLRVPRADVINDSDTGRLLALAYPDRVAQRRPGRDDRFLLRNGVGAVLAHRGTLSAAPFIAIADLDGRSPHSRIFLGAPLDRADLDTLFADAIVTEDSVTWDADAGVVVAVRRKRLGAIVLKEASLHEVDGERRSRVVLDALRTNNGISLPWSDSAVRLRERIAFLRSLDTSWPLVDVESLLADDDILLPHLTGVRRRADIERVPLTDILLDRLTWEQRRQLDELAPTHVVVPTGSRIPVDYSDASAPFVAVRLQEMFGLAETPRIANGRVALTLQLLSPAHRPVQVTSDLAGFWRSSYFSVRKDLRGRYPKHEWPEDPLNAAPTRRAKPRK